MRRVVVTKITPPSAPPEMTRARLLERLEGLTRQHPVALVQAPAGFGKTTLLATWAKASGAPVAWYTFDPDDTLEELTRHLCHAATVEPSKPDAFLCWISQAGPLTIVLEDCHLAKPPLLGYLERLCLRRSEAVRLVLTTRGPISLSLGRLEVRALVGRLESRDLALTEAEHLEISRKLGLQDEFSQKLHRLSEGWPACSEYLLRAAPGLPDSAEETSLLDPVRGVLEEAYRDFPPPVRDTLCVLSLLERSTPELAQAVGVDGRTLDLGGFPFIREEGWFRINRLLAGFLRQRAWQELGESRQREIHERASEWHESRGDADMAILHGQLGQAWERVGRLLAKGKRPLELITLYRQSLSWLQSIPQASMDETLYARLGLAYWSAMRWQEACAAFTQALGSGRPNLEFLCRSSLAKCHDSLGLVESSRAWAARAREIPIEQSDETTALGHFMLSATLAADGRIAEADRMLRDEPLEAAHPQHPPLFVGNLSGVLRLRQGRLAEAERLIRGTIERSRETRHVPHERVGWALLACCQYEGGRLIEALASAKRYLEAGGQPGELSIRRPFLGVYLGILRARGQRDEADDVLQTCLEEADCPGTATLAASVLIEEGALSKASELLRQHYHGLDIEPYDGRRHLAYTTHLRLWLEAPGELEPRFWSWLKVLEPRAELDGRWVDRLKLRLLKAGGLARTRQTTQARDLIEECLAWGRPLGLVAPFMEQTLEVRSACLSTDASLARDAHQWCRLLLLSSREQEVLELVARGASNRDISERCFLSLHTVKWHNQKIFRKLGVTNRKDAVALWRQEKGLPPEPGEG